MNGFGLTIPVKLRKLFAEMSIDKSMEREYNMKQRYRNGVSLKLGGAY